MKKFKLSLFIASIQLAMALIIAYLIDFENKGLLSYPAVLLSFFAGMRIGHAPMYLNEESNEKK